METQRIVIKVGTNALAMKNTMKINQYYMESLVHTIVNLQKSGKQVILVTSGSILAGMEEENLQKKPIIIKQLQRLSSIGQPLLMQMFRDKFKKFNIKIGQILIEDSTIKSDKRRKSFVDNVNTLLKNGNIPIINENDAIAVEEIRIGDNDVLSAYVAKMMNADLLAILSDVDGLHNKNPQHKDAVLIKKVNWINTSLKKMADGANEKGLGTGGMSTKIKAVKICLCNNICIAIMNSNKLDQLDNLLKGENFTGTLFQKESRLPNWILDLLGYFK